MLVKHTADHGSNDCQVDCATLRLDSWVVDGFGWRTLQPNSNALKNTQKHDCNKPEPEERHLPIGVNQSLDAV